MCVILSFNDSNLFDKILSYSHSLTTRALFLRLPDSAGMMSPCCAPHRNTALFASEKGKPGSFLQSLSYTHDLIRLHTLKGTCFSRIHPDATMDTQSRTLH